MAGPLIVGDISTHGKGTVQSLNPLKPFMINSTNDPGELKITIRKFYRISGASTQLKGVTPDMVLPDVFNYWTDRRIEPRQPAAVGHHPAAPTTTS